MRSSRNQNTLIKNTIRTKNVLRKYLEFIEDEECLRMDDKAAEVIKRKIEKNIKKIVPENFKISLFPSYFNTCDTERIGTILKDSLNDFLLNTTKKVMFSIAIRVFNYNHNVNSIRIIIAKMFPSETITNNTT